MGLSTNPWRVPMSSPDLTTAEIAAVSEVLQSGTLSLGPRLGEFERRMASFLGVRHVVGVSSGTAALHLSVIAAGVDAGAFVITTPFSFVASSNCILYERAIPIFVDVDDATGNIDPDLVAEAVRDLVEHRNLHRWLPPSLRDGTAPSGRLRALLPVHAFGQPADMDRLMAIAQPHDLVVIEDACEALGAQYKGHQAGTLGHVAAFGFYPNKQMTTAEGGTITTNRSEWDALFRSLRNQGRDVFDAWLVHGRLGYNYRLSELGAALGVVQLQRIEELLGKRARVAHWYNERLADVEQIRLPVPAPSTTRVSWFVYVIRLAPELDRVAIMTGLREEGIPSRPYFTPIHLQPFYAERFGYRLGDYPRTESLGDSCLALPFSAVMRESQVDEVCEHLLSAIRRQPACR